MALLMDPAFCIDILRKHLSRQDVAEVCDQRQQKDPQISHQRQQKNPQIYVFIYAFSATTGDQSACAALSLCCDGIDLKDSISGTSTATSLLVSSPT